MSRDYEITKLRIKKHEGYEEQPYYLSYTTADGKEISEDFQTGGYGHKFKEGEQFPVRADGTTVNWDAVFENDFKIAQDGARSLVGEKTINPQAFGLVTEMVYQMGTTGVSNFKNTLAAIQSGDYKLAAVEMLDSKWAKQTPNRAAEMALIMSGL